MSTLAELEAHDAFVARHIGPSDADITRMLQAIGQPSLEAMSRAIVPEGIYLNAPLALPGARSEEEALSQLRALAKENRVFKNFIGQGYYGTHTPAVILRILQHRQRRRQRRHREQ
ncbi:MAG TPA: hypothetical protein PLQ67_07765, partial [Burkholderiaceae bacterium]|nr:hypothetical protein [Burkholderiaceae bacterium]